MGVDGVVHPKAPALTQKDIDAAVLHTLEKQPLPTSLDKKHMGHVDKLSKAKAENFDRDFAKQMVDDHQKDIKKFKHIADKGDNAELKQFASQTVPVLEEHLAMARDLTGKGKGGGKGGSK